MNATAKKGQLSFHMLIQLLYEESQSVNVQICLVKKNKLSCQEQSKYQQESPPAWTQEAYRPPCSHSNFLVIAGGGGGPSRKNFFFPVWTCIKPNLLSKIFPFTKTRYPPPPPPAENLRPGTPPPPRNVNRQTPVKTVPSRHTTYAGGKKHNRLSLIYGMTISWEIKVLTSCWNPVRNLYASSSDKWIWTSSSQNLK